MTPKISRYFKMLLQVAFAVGLGKRIGVFVSKNGCEKCAGVRWMDIIWCSLSSSWKIKTHLNKKKTFVDLLERLAVIVWKPFFT